MSDAAKTRAAGNFNWASDALKCFLPVRRRSAERVVFSKALDKKQNKHVYYCYYVQWYTETIRFAIT